MPFALCRSVTLDITVKKTAQSVWSKLSSKAMTWSTASMARRNTYRPMGNTPSFSHQLHWSTSLCSFI